MSALGSRFRGLIARNIGFRMELLGTPKVRLGVPAQRFPIERLVEELMFAKQNYIRKMHFLLERQS